MSYRKLIGYRSSHNNENGYIVLNAIYLIVEDWGNITAGVMGPGGDILYIVINRPCPHLDSRHEWTPVYSNRSDG